MNVKAELQKYGISNDSIQTFGTTPMPELLDYLAAEFQREHKRPPSQRELAQLHEEAWDDTRKGKPEGAIDFDALHSGWALKLMNTSTG